MNKKLSAKDLIEKLKRTPIFPYLLCIECKGLGYVDKGDFCPSCKGRGMIHKDNQF